MYDFHPFLTSFPVTLIFLATFAEIASYLRERIFWLKFNLVTLLLGAAFSLLTFLSGLLASANVDQVSKPVEALIADHYSFAKLILFIYIPLILFRFLRFDKKIFNHFYIFLLILQLTLIFYTSNLGGKLVFDFGVGIDSSPR